MKEIFNTFLKSNLQFILGAAIGTIGTIISVLAYNFSTPKIEIDKMDLVIPGEIVKDLKNLGINQLKSSFLKYYLEIVVRNKRGGPGSIDKPNLLIKYPKRKMLGIILSYETFTLKPVTEHTEYETGIEALGESRTVRHGRAFNLGGGEKVDEKLEYPIYIPKTIHAIVQNSERLMYSIEYWDNKGKRHEKPIKKIII